MTGPLHNRGLSLLVLALFFLSGIASLIYQVVWVRMLASTIGGSNLTISIVLAVFMAGLGIGCFLISRRIDRVDNPSALVLLYGIIELLIGISGVLVPLVLHFAGPLQAVIYQAFYLRPYTYNFVTLFTCATVLIVPTILMGATFPVLCRYYILALDHVGTRVGRLYMVNTLGAAVGALFAGFHLIPFAGVRGALWSAVAINVAIAAVSIVIFSRDRSWTSLAAFAAPVGRASRTSRPAGSFGLLALFAVSGFCSMAYEVIWTRLLGLLVGPTTYSFTLVLFTFIAGLGIGSMVFGWLGDRTRRIFGLLIATQMCAAALALGVSQLLGTSQLFFAKLLFSLKDNFVMQQTWKAIAIFLLMLPATLCLGAAFPLVGKLYTRSVKSVGETVGGAYAVNTVGSVLGALAAGFLLIPALGKEHGIALLVLLQSTVAGIVFCRAAGVRPWLQPTAVGTVALLAVLCFLYPDWNRALLADGKFHRFDELSVDLDEIGFMEALLRGDRALENAIASNELLYYGDGIAGFTTVVASESPLGVRSLVLSNNGKPDASSHGDQGTQVLLGQLPMILHPSPKSVMVLGLASGVTAGETLLYPIESLDILEFSPEVIEASRFFDQWNGRVLEDPRTQVIMQDARTHLAYTDRRYDVIISEPSNPWMAGLASVFTAEFFRTARQHMNAEGIFVQWLHSYQLDWETFAMIGRTFTSVFPNSVLFRNAQEADYLLVGMDDSTTLSIETARKKLVYAARSTNFRLGDPAVLFSLIVSEDLYSLFDNGPIHTDNWPHLEYSAPRQLYASGADIGVRIRKAASGSPEKAKRWALSRTSLKAQIDLADFLTSLHSPPFGLVNHAALDEDSRNRYQRILEAYCRNNLIPHYASIPSPAERSLAQRVQRQALTENLKRLLETNADASARSATYSSLGHVLASMEEFDEAARCFSLAHLLRPARTDVVFNIGLCYERLGRNDDALVLFQKLREGDPSSVKVLARIAANHLRLEHTDTAFRLFHDVLRLDNRNAAALLGLSAIYGTRGDFVAAAEYSGRAIAAEPSAGKAYQNAAIALLNLGRTDDALRCVQDGLQVDPSNIILRQIATNFRTPPERSHVPTAGSRRQ